MIGLDVIVRVVLISFFPVEYLELGDVRDCLKHV